MYAENIILGFTTEAIHERVLKSCSVSYSDQSNNANDSSYCQGNRSITQRWCWIRASYTLRLDPELPLDPLSCLYLPGTPRSQGALPILIPVGTDTAVDHPAP